MTRVAERNGRAADDVAVIKRISDNDAAVAAFFSAISVKVRL